LFSFSAGPFQNFFLINAKVPILRFRDTSNTIEIDLNYNNCVGVRNTHLLFSYSQSEFRFIAQFVQFFNLETFTVDWRLRPLALVVKLWAQYHNINDARNSTISSYSLVLMVIHFLQFAVKPAVLPCLHQLCPDKFRTLHDITTIDMVEKVDLDWKSDNRQPLGELFLRFLDYYSNFE
jgi:poly(A) RNA polymerase GLD2